MVERHVLEAVVRLGGSPDFGVFMDELRRRKEAARDSAEVAPDLLLVGRAQGASVLAGELIQLVAEAPGALAKQQAAKPTAAAPGHHR